MENSNNLLERFLRYVKTWTESNTENADKGIQPSSPMQTEFAKELEKELKVGEYLGSINEIFYRENETNSIYVRIYDSAYYKFDLTTGELLDEFIVYNPYNDLQIN